MKSVWADEESSDEEVGTRTKNVTKSQVDPKDQPVVNNESKFVWVKDAVSVEQVLSQINKTTLREENSGQIRENRSDSRGDNRGDSRREYRQEYRNGDKRDAGRGGLERLDDRYGRGGDRAKSNPPRKYQGRSPQSQDAIRGKPQHMGSTHVVAPSAPKPTEPAPGHLTVPIIPAERPKLVLAARTESTEPAPVSLNSKIFGEAKPRDEKLYQEKTKIKEAATPSSTVATTANGLIDVPYAVEAPKSTATTTTSIDGGKSVGGRNVTNERRVKEGSDRGREEGIGRGRDGSARDSRNRDGRGRGREVREREGRIDVESHREFGSREGRGQGRESRSGEGGGDNTGRRGDGDGRVKEGRGDGRGRSRPNPSGRGHDGGRERARDGAEPAATITEADGAVVGKTEVNGNLGASASSLASPLSPDTRSSGDAYIKSRETNVEQAGAAGEKRRTQAAGKGKNKDQAHH